MVRESSESSKGLEVTIWNILDVPERFKPLIRPMDSFLIFVPREFDEKYYLPIHRLPMFWKQEVEDGIIYSLDAS